MSLLIVIVNYKDSSRTIKFVNEELTKIKLIDWKLIIVNNESDDQNDSLLSEKLDLQIISNDFEKNEYLHSKKGYLISSRINLGFAKGNNLGVQFAINNDILFEYILFSNNDIYINDQNTIQELLSPLNSYKNIGIVGPEIIGLNGERQSPEPYYPYFYRTIGRYVFSKIPSRMKKYYSDYSRSAKSGEHYKIMGSFFLMSKIAFEMIGGFDENTFLYGEEVILSEKLKSKNMTVFFNSKVTVVHAHSVTISNKYNSHQKFQLQYNSEKYYYRKYRKIGLISMLLADLFTWIYIKLKFN